MMTMTNALTLFSLLLLLAPSPSWTHPPNASSDGQEHYCLFEGDERQLSAAPRPLPASSVDRYIPSVPGVDRSPSLDIGLDGRCTRAVEAFAQTTSHWCKFNRTVSWPPFAADDPARRVYKFGRLTVYNGPILAQKFACNVDGIGSDRYATVALSTRYLKTWQGGWNPTSKGACGRCVCVTLYGGDVAYNRGLQRWVVAKYRGLSFMGKVGDRMGEGSDQSIDILLDRPFAYAWPGPENPNARRVNGLRGLRAFTRVSGPEAPHSVGTWTALWNFAPCAWTHADCARLASNVTSLTTRTPSITPPL